MKPRIVTLDGIFLLNQDGFYEPEREEEETRLPLWAGLLPIVLIGFAATCGAIYCASMAWRAWHG